VVRWEAFESKITNIVNKATTIDENTKRTTLLYHLDNGPIAL